MEYGAATSSEIAIATATRTIRPGTMASGWPWLRLAPIVRLSDLKIREVQVQGTCKAIKT